MFAFRKVLVPVDFSPESRRALEYAAFLARPFEASLELLHVWEPPHYLAADIMVAAPGWNPVEIDEAIAKGSREGLAKLQKDAEVELAGLTVTTGIVRGHPGDGIVRRAEEGKFDAIVMGTHGRSALGRILLGSVAAFTVARAPCPVITVRGG